MKKTLVIFVMAAFAASTAAFAADTMTSTNEAPAHVMVHKDKKKKKKSKKKSKKSHKSHKSADAAPAAEAAPMGQ